MKVPQDVSKLNQSPQKYAKLKDKELVNQNNLASKDHLELHHHMHVR
jgi:hypothetical protein